MTFKSAKAKQLASLSNPVLVFAAHKVVTASAVRTAEYASYRCVDKKCSLEVAFGAGSDFEPFCPHCGSDLQPVPGAPAPAMDPIQEDSLTNVPCPSCSTQNVISDDALNILGGKVCCTACSTEIPYQMAEVAETDDIEDEDEGEPGEQEVNDAPADEDTEETADGTPVSEDDAPGVDGDNASTQINEDELTEQLVADTDEPDDGAAEVEMDITDAVDLTDDSEVDVEEDSCLTDTLTASVDGMPVMRLEKANAGDNTDLFHSVKFHKALASEVKKGGLQVLAAYGFKPVTINVPLGKIVERRVQAALAEQKAQITASINDLSKDYGQSLQLAGLALTRNFYRNRSNVLADRLIATLEGLGIKQAKRIVQTEMASVGSAFVKDMIELAEELVAKPLDIRNQLAETLVDMNPEALASGDLESPEEDEDKTSPAEVVARLSAPVRPRTNAKSTQTAAVAGDTASKLARLRELS